MAETVEITDKKYPKALKEALKNLIASLGPKKLYYKGNWVMKFLKIVWQLWVRAV